MSDKPISEIVKDPEWQRIRQKLLNKWKTNPVECCKILEKYLGDVHKADIDKLRILKNYLYFFWIQNRSYQTSLY